MPSFKIIGLLVLEIFKVFAIYSHGGYFGHVTWTLYINFLRMLHMKFDFDWLSRFLMYVYIILFCKCNLVAAYWEIDAHSDYDICSGYKC